MVGRTIRRWVGVALVSALAGFLACREPTQVTLIVTTDAGCPGDDQVRPRLNDVIIFSGKQIALNGGDLVPNASTEQCSAADPNMIGTLVFLPDGGDNPAVEVLVVAGVQRDANDDSESKSAGACMAVVNDPDETKRSIEGLPCIVARRRLTFVPHNSLVLPINLDRRCIGQECGADLTCFEGNCVNPDVTCTDGEGCTSPKGCTDDCDKGCGSGHGICNDGTCKCQPCDPQLCNGSCVDDTCVCGDLTGECSPDVCDTACPSQCDDSTQVHACDSGGCVCDCDPGKCQTHCAPTAKPIGTCNESTQQCECQPMPGEGGGGMGGGGMGGVLAGGNGGILGAGGNGGILGAGGNGGILGAGGNGGILGAGGNGGVPNGGFTGNGGIGPGAGGVGGSGGSCDPASCQPSCTFGLHGSCPNPNGPCMCVCNPTLCIGPGGCTAGDFHTCTGMASCDCTCQAGSCNGYCQSTFGAGWFGTCSSEPFGDCDCFPISGTSTSTGTSTSSSTSSSTNSSTSSGASCNPVSAPNCPMCAAACQSQPGCSWDSTCAPGPPAICGCQ